MRVLPVGIDVAKATFTAALWENGTGVAVGSYPNSEVGIDACLAEVRQIQHRTQATTVQIALEPTAGYELCLATTIIQRGWQVSMVNAVQVRDWAKSQGRRAKTDAQDAVMLARYAAEHPRVPGSRCRRRSVSWRAFCDGGTTWNTCSIRNETVSAS